MWDLDLDSNKKNWNYENNENLFDGIENVKDKSVDSLNNEERDNSNKEFDEDELLWVKDKDWDFNYVMSSVSWAFNKWVESKDEYKEELLKKYWLDWRDFKWWLEKLVKYNFNLFKNLSLNSKIFLFSLFFMFVVVVLILKLVLWYIFSYFYLYLNFNFSNWLLIRFFTFWLFVLVLYLFSNMLVETKSVIYNLSIIYISVLLLLSVFFLLWYVSFNLIFNLFFVWLVVISTLYIFLINEYEFNLLKKYIKETNINEKDTKEVAEELLDNIKVDEDNIDLDDIDVWEDEEVVDIYSEIMEKYETEVDWIYYSKKWELILVKTYEEWLVE